ncbi:uncharacterized protein N7487_005897 [Penicillium crustosum]|uniref:uncharacterized protein n=1 Tax=Penicillium crustosum TaxID=36656 RepID=UPI0023A54C7E|nr:uncharacterized protein N7487_005897 [Penicillium crustosum]KAJ5411538.1 hypothetical protein N7487_005897 [Penicillium crustosum]
MPWRDQIPQLTLELRGNICGSIMPWCRTPYSLHAPNVSVLQLQYLGTLRARPMLIGEDERLTAADAVAVR